MCRMWQGEQQKEKLQVWEQCEPQLLSLPKDSMAAAQEDGALGNAAAAAPQRAPGELEERSSAPSRVWGAQPGLLFQGEKQSCHPLVSTTGQESSPGAPCSAPLPQGILGESFPYY